jgi:CDP-4-dehydro-6-deoxyglucose reductase
MRLQLRLPLHANLAFVAGQYIDIILPDGRRRAYSIANEPVASGVINLELHIRHYPGGAFTDRVFGEMKARDMLQIEAPLGSFFLRDSQKPAIFLATGTGYAPIRAMLRETAASRLDRPITLYWGARELDDL